MIAQCSYDCTCIYEYTIQALVAVLSHTKGKLRHLTTNPEMSHERVTKQVYPISLLTSQMHTVMTSERFTYHNHWTIITLHETPQIG